MLEQIVHWLATADSPQSPNSRCRAVLGSTLPTKHLAALGVVDCDLDDDSAYLIAEFISKCQSLRMVCVEENNFSEQAKDSIVKAGSKLAGCTTIV